MNSCQLINKYHPILSPLLFFLFLGLSCIPSLWADWPEHRGNLQRTGYHEQVLQSKYWAPLWRLDRLSPSQPAWPAPAKASLWQKLESIDARVTDDQVDVPLIVQDSNGRSHVLIASSASDRLFSIDPQTGDLQWQYVARAPIRYAPSVSNGIAYLGADDGLVRAVDISNGKEVWRTRIGPAMPWIVGNGRMISSHPIRTSVVVQEGLVFATAGLFPSQGVYSVALAIDSGDVVWRRKIMQSPQGYLLADQDKIYLPTGRSQPFAVKKTDGRFLYDLPSPGGSFCMLTPEAFFSGPGNNSTIEGKSKQIGAKMLSFQGKQFAAGGGKIWTSNGVRLVGHSMAAVLRGEQSTTWSIDCELDQSLIVSGETGDQTLFVAGGPEIRLYDADTGEARGLLSVDDPEAEIKSLAVSRLRGSEQELLVAATVSGKVFAWQGVKGIESGAWPKYSRGRGELTAVPSVAPAIVEEVRQTLVSPRGWALVLEDGNGSLVNALLEKTHLKIVSLISDQESVLRLQEDFRRRGLYGHRVTVWQHAETNPLPFSKGVFNVLLEANSTAHQTADLLDYVAPETGCLWRLSRKERLLAPRQKGVGVWRHQYANPGNSAATQDQMVGNAESFRLLWFGGVGPSRMPDRHLRGPAPLTAGGAAVMQGDGVLIGIDPANGTERWQLELPDSAMRYVTPFDAGYACLTTEGNELIVAANQGLWRVDAYSGEILSSIEVGEEDACWGYVAEVNGNVFASVMKSTAPRTAIDNKTRFTYVDSDYRSERPLVTSRRLDQWNLRGARNWSYESQGVILNGTIALNDQQVVFVEARSPDCVQHETDRISLATLMETPYLVSLCSDSGEIAWETPLDWSDARNMLYAQLVDNKVVLTTSKSQGDKAHYMIRVVNAEDGSPIWTAEHEHVKNGLFHGEQVHHPVILNRPDGQIVLVAEPYLYNLATGLRTVPDGAAEDWALKRPGHSCGTLSGAGNSLFFRASNPTVLNLENSTFTALAPTRAGCWINMIPAGGRLLIPEGSASCVCHYSLQTSMAFAPIAGRGPDKEIPTLPDVLPKREVAVAKPLYRWLFTLESIRDQSFLPAVGEVLLNASEPPVFLSDGLVLNGTQWLANHLDFARLPRMPETITLEAWVQIDASPKWCGIVGAVQDNGSYERGCMLGVHDGRFFFSLASDQRQSLTYLESPTPLEKGKLSHIVGTYDGSLMRLYINGVEVAQSDQQQGSLLVDEKSWLAVGAYKDNDEFYPLKGVVRSVTIYDGVVDTETIGAAH
ncbi:MAG: PQQ-binding-like beta-propeller repeat protein [Mariniblastus sp.]|nr:PQQ-binding-like beta-propeller repeat protein [Mariniblastus sp.]